MSNATTNTPSSAAATKTKTVGRIMDAFTGTHTSAADSNSNGKRMYKMANGQTVELPPDMSMEDAAKLESEATAAQKKLKGPSPKPTPDVKEKSKVKDKKQGKVKPKGKKGAGGKLAGAKSKAGGKNDSKAAKSIKGKVGAWLMAKGAPAIARGQSKLQQLKTNEQTHDDAGTKLSQTEKAVVPPVVEAQSTGNAGQVDSVESKPVPQPSEAVAKQKLNEAITDNIPQNIEDVDNFKKNNKAGLMSSAVSIVVNKDKNEVAGTFGDMKQTPAPVKSDVVPEELPPDEIAPVTAKMSLGNNTIAPSQKEHTDVSNYTKEADSKLKEEGVTQEQLDMVDSGDLAAANKEKKGMEKTAKTEPLAVTQFAQQANKKVDTELQQEENKGRDEIKNKRKQKLKATKDKQKGTKSGIEKKREEVAIKINGIYKRASDKVTKKLADLETVAIKRFDDGNAKATKEFEDTVKRELDAFKDDRYSGFWGWARKAKDWVLGMEDLPRVKAIFENNRTIFVNTINTLVDSITQDNKKVIQECKEELTAARTEIKDFVDKLGPELKDAGKKAQDEMNSQLDELDKTINKKEEELQNKLKDKQAAAIKAIDEKIEKMKEAMSGALSKLGKLLLLAAKKFFSWALEKFGFSLAEIDSIINKGAAVLKAIFTQPIQFVKNLMNAAITGFKNFGKNFLKHLKDALFEWLTGSLEGLTLPKVWDFQGIISIGLQMIGISYANIRRHMVAVMSEPVVAGLEKTFTLVKTLITEGPMAAWEQLKEMAGEMRDAFIDAVKDFIKTKIIEQAITWIVGIFVPGAGIVKAIIGIYDTIVFFINKAKQIMQMISNFLGSISEIASGNIGAAADAMENGLARGLSLVINFLAQLLHLNGVTDKIRNAIQKIRDKVDAVLLKVAKWIAEKAKKLFNAITGKDKKQPEDDKEKQAKKEGLTDLTFEIKEPVEMSAAGHNIIIQFDKGKSKVLIASTVADFIIALGNAIKEVNSNDKFKSVRASYLKTLKDVKKDVEGVSQEMDDPFVLDKILFNVNRDSASRQAAIRKYIIGRLADIARNLSGFASTANIKALDDFYKAAPSERYIPGYPSQKDVGVFIRKKLYDQPFGWSAFSDSYKATHVPGVKATIVQIQTDAKNAKAANNSAGLANAQSRWNTEINEGRVDIGGNISTYNPNAITYHTDHIEPLVDRWNATGFNSGDSTRDTHLKINLQILTEKHNTSKGGMGSNYTPFVGPKFVSSVAEGGLVNATKVAGEPFLDAAGKPL